MAAPSSSETTIEIELEVAVGRFRAARHCSVVQPRPKVLTGPGRNRRRACMDLPEGVCPAATGRAALTSMSHQRGC